MSSPSTASDRAEENEVIHVSPIPVPVEVGPLAAEPPPGHRAVLAGQADHPADPVHDEPLVAVLGGRRRRVGPAARSTSPRSTSPPAASTARSATTRKARRRSASRWSSASAEDLLHRVPAPFGVRDVHEAAVVRRRSSGPRGRPVVGPQRGAPRRPIMAPKSPTPWPRSALQDPAPNGGRRARGRGRSSAASQAAPSVQPTALRQRNADATAISVASASSPASRSPRTAWRASSRRRRWSAARRAESHGRPGDARPASAARCRRWCSRAASASPASADRSVAKRRMVSSKR